MMYDSRTSLQTLWQRDLVLEATSVLVRRGGFSAERRMLQPRQHQWNGVIALIPPGSNQRCLAAARALICFKLFQAGCCLGKLLIRFLQPARCSYGKQWEIIPCMGKCLCSGQNALVGEPSCIAFVSGWFEGNVEALTMQKINSFLSVRLPVRTLVKRGTAKLETQRSSGGFVQNFCLGGEAWLFQPSEMRQRE